MGQKRPNARQRIGRSQAGKGEGAERGGRRRRRGQRARAGREWSENEATKKKRERVKERKKRAGEQTKEDTRTHAGIDTRPRAFVARETDAAVDIRSGSETEGQLGVTMNAMPAARDAQ